MSGHKARSESPLLEEQAGPGQQSRSPAGRWWQPLGAQLPQQDLVPSTAAEAQPARPAGLEPHWTPMPIPRGPFAVTPGAFPQAIVQPQQPQHGSSANYRTIELADLPDGPAQSRHRRQCERLGQEIDRAWKDTGDSPLRNLLDSRDFSIGPEARPSTRHRMRSLQAFLQLTLWNIDARGAIAWVLTSDWDLEQALQAYMTQRFQVDGAPGSEILTAPQATEVTSSASEPSIGNISNDERESDEETMPEPYVDEDPDNIGNVPDGILDTYIDPRTEEEIPCARHESIRGYLIRQAAAKGQYRYGRARGDHADDQTSFLKAQRNWGFDTREHYPPITFVFKRSDRSNPAYPNDKIPYMRWRGLLVVDYNGKPVQRFNNVPATLSTQIEGGLIEALSRGDSRVDTTDLLARMRRRWSKPKAGGGRLNYDMQPNTLAQRATRFRQDTACIHWYGRTTAVKPFDRFLQDNLPDVLRDANNTRGLARDLIEREVNLMKTSHQLAQPPVIDFDLVEEFPSGGELARSAYHPAEEHDCRDCMPSDLADFAALNDAILITLMDFIEGTGMCPRVPLTKMAYNDLYAVIKDQLMNQYAGTGNQRPRLRKLGRWTGGIRRWRSGPVLNG
ncbi:MAG: hypothetical protein LQ343_000179 [Gyalolechia ehrenbergii]|nr:MAG: hypothetical protein LQ343_000179 [Gyalolechia ehrenbergii]